MEHMTSNPASVIDESQFTVRRTIHIAAPVEKVWSAVTEPEHISQWFGKAVFDGVGVGARGTLTFPDYGLPDEVDDEHSTVFTFTLEPVSNGTQLTVVETGFERTSDPAANLESHRQGWDGELDKLVALLEGGA